MHFAACAVLLLVFVAPAGPAEPARPAQAKRHFAAIERRVFELVNERRRERGLGELRWNEPLAQEARRHALNMAGRRFFSHVDPVRGDLRARLHEDGIRWRRIAENIFQEQGYQDPAAKAVQSWMNSAGHRRNILDNLLTGTGVGVAVRGDGTYCIVQAFLRP